MNKVALLRCLIHALIWGGFFWLNVQYFRNWLPENKIFVSDQALLLYCATYFILLMAVPYLNYFLLLPRLYFQKCYLSYGLLMVLATITVCWLKVELDAFFMPVQPYWLRTAGHYISTLPYLFVFTILMGWFRLSEEWSLKLRQEEALKRAKMEAELRWLKGQISPHFLFNTLNNIHSLVHFKSEEAGPMLVKLSDMMRYLLHECNQPLIALSREIQYLDDYIALQCVKKRRRARVSWHVENAGPEQYIEPMLFINFVENAFKHGNIDQEGGGMSICFRQREDQIYFEIENTYQPMGSKDKTPGIGINNVRQRLQLTYPGAHNLAITDTGTHYRVALTLHVAPALPQHYTSFPTDV